MNRAWLANIGSGYFHQPRTYTVFRRAECWTVAARHAYPQKQAEDIFMSSFLSYVNPSRLPDF